MPPRSPLPAGLTRLITRVRARVPAPDAPRVYFANHSSHLDTLSVVSEASLQDNPRPHQAGGATAQTGLRRWPRGSTECAAW